MSRPLAWCLVALLAVGCESGEEPVRGAKPGSTQRLVDGAPAAPREPADTPRPERAVELPSIDEGAEQAEERDLASELRAALGVPMDCVRDYVATAPTTIRVGVSATVRPTGMLITPSVHGAGLSAEARQCIEQRVDRLTLRPLGEPVSQTVSTIVEMEFTPEVIVEADPGVPEPRLRNVVEPLPKRPEVAPSGRPIQAPTSKEISGGFDGGRPIDAPTSRKVTGPKPKPIEGYDLDENAQEWR